MPRPSRRHLLASLAVVSVGGCLSEDSGGGESELGEVKILNYHDESHTVELRVTWAGDVVHERAYEVAPNPQGDELSGVMADPTWPDEPGTFTLSAQLSGASWRTVDPANSGYPDCFAALIEIDSRGTLGILKSTDSAQCQDETTGGGSTS